MHSLAIVTLCLLATSFATAQTATLRGKVEDVQGTQNKFYLGGTRLPLVSTALNLNTWLGQQAELQVTNVGPAAAPVLRVDAAVTIAASMDMGNLGLGKTSTFEVAAPTGAFTFLFVDFTDNGGFAPIQGAGTYLLGAAPALLAQGFTNAPNRFQVQFTMPTDQTLLGFEITSQAVFGTVAGGWQLSNVDSKVVQP